MRSGSNPGKRGNVVGSTTPLTAPHVILIEILKKIKWMTDLARFSDNQVVL